MSTDLHGAVALVTGASSGIGAAVAEQLAGAGASVVLVARRRDGLDAVAAHIESAGGHALAVAADVADPESARAAVGWAVSRCERLDIVVNAAGTATLTPFATSAPGSWQQMIDANLAGVLNVSHAALQHLLAAAADSPRGVSDLVTISSTAGRRVSAAGGVYAATKHAVGAFSESLRQELTSRSVRVGLVEPGFVDTPLTAGLSPGYDFLHARDVADAVSYMVGRPAGTAVNEVLLRATGQVA
jgi:NADP-dependent 3-hydroxy acid dehydrogenase YdfG